MDRDMNLLFGVVAVQYEQVTSSDFIRAVETWANEPTKSLSAYLVKFGALSASDRDFVQNLVDKELKECGGDPSAALQRVGGDEAVQLSSLGNISLVGSHGLKLGPPQQPRTDSLATELIDDEESSLARSALKTEAVAWRLIGFVTIAVMLISVLGIFFYSRIVDERNAALEARRLAEERLKLAERQQHLDREALLIAEGQRIEMEQLQNVAKRQKELALDAIKRMVFELPGRLGVVSEANPVLRELLKENIAVLDSILSLEPESIDLQIEESGNQALIGLIWKRLGEPSESVTAYEDAVAIAKGVSEQRPDEMRHTRTLARRHRDLGAAYSAVSSYDDALAEFEKSLRINEKLLEADSGVCELREELAKAHAEVGNVLILRGDSARAVESYGKSLDFNEKLLESGVHYGAPNQSIESLDSVGIYEIAVALWRATQESDGENPETRIGLAQGEQNLGLVYAQYGSYDEARLHLHNSLSAYQELSEPGRLPATKPLEGQARVHYDLGLIHSVQGSFEAAKAAYERGIAIANDIFEIAPESATIRLRLAACTFAMGRLHLGLGEYERASARFGQMLDIYRSPTARDAVLNAEAGSIYPMYAQALGELRHLARAKEALKLREAYIGLLRYFALREPENAQILTRLANTYVMLGTSLERDEQTNRARESFMSALKILEAQASKNPDDANLETRITRVQFRLSRIDEGQ